MMELSQLTEEIDQLKTDLWHAHAERDQALLDLKTLR